MIMDKRGKKGIKRELTWILLGFFLVESLSFAGYLYPLVNQTAFILIFISAVIFSLKDLKYGFYLVFAELLIGGQGYLFHFGENGSDISVRIALWVAVMSVYLAKAASTGIFNEGSSYLKRFKRTELPYFGVLFLFVMWGICNGAINGNGFSNIFLDANGWFYLLLILPIYHVFITERASASRLLGLFAVAMTWLSAKTLFLEYVFSHRMNSITRPLYRWVRTSGIGEITLMDSGFTRIFFQSHIFILIAFFLLAFLLNKRIKEGKIRLLDMKSAEFKTGWALVLSLGVAICVILISLSRSFWLAAAIVFAFYLVLTVQTCGWKNSFKAVSVIFLSFAVGLLLLGVMIRFPYPMPSEVKFTDALNERATKISGESAVSSRFKLLPKLAAGIEEAPLLGRGFGASITYKSNDPRILASTVDGEYTTYAFEWGWLDIWLEMGLLSAAFYLFLNLRIAAKNSKRGDWLSLSLAAGVLLLITVNFFTPYLNHPLGLGYLMVAGLASDLKDR